MLIKTRGLVFRAINYAETSIICDIYTEEKGLRSYIVSGVRTKKASVHASLLRPMSLVDMVAYHRDDQDLARVKELRPAVVYHNLPFDVAKGAVGLFMVELSAKSIRESEPNRPLFAFLMHSFLMLDQAAEGVANFPFLFALQLSRFLGFWPSGQHSSETPFFDLENGDFVSTPNFCTIDAGLGKCLGDALRISLERAAGFRASRAERRALLDALLRYYRFHLENMPELHSHKVLQEVF
jgi:DNA repair protein RecO (recombination protein O)